MECYCQHYLEKRQLQSRWHKNIPSVQSCIKFASDTVSMLPIKLYKEVGEKVAEVKDDKRVRLLNDETGDTLDAVQFWKAMVADYYLGKGGYAYIKKGIGEVESIHYVDESQVSISKNTDPIFKDYGVMVNAKEYKPFDFIKLVETETKKWGRGN